MITHYFVTYQAGLQGSSPIVCVITSLVAVEDGTVWNLYWVTRVLGTRNRVLGIRYLLVTRTRYFVLGTCYLTIGTYYVHSTR